MSINNFISDNYEHIIKSTHYKVLLETERRVTKVLTLIIEFSNYLKYEIESHIVTSQYSFNKGTKCPISEVTKSGTAIPMLSSCHL